VQSFAASPTETKEKYIMEKKEKTLSQVFHAGQIEKHKMYDYYDIFMEIFREELVLLGRIISIHTTVMLLCLLYHYTGFFM
jgi:hypothetical protein